MPTFDRIADLSLRQKMILTVEQIEVFMMVFRDTFNQVENRMCDTEKDLVEWFQDRFTDSSSMMRQLQRFAVLRNQYPFDAKVIYQFLLHLTEEYKAAVDDPKEWHHK